ncbi:MAG: hypothetical protein KKB50_09210 [Planctomycetes bacterium]|nr:hypothetical protein [Planctomycetota bacterium]
MSRPVEPERARPLRIVNGQVHATFGWAGGTVLGLGLLLVLFVVFQAGVRYAQQPAQARDAANQTSEALPQSYGDTSGEAGQPDDRPLRGGSDAARAPSGAPGATGQPPPSATPRPATHSFQFQPGYHYVTVQHFPRSRLRAAEAARAFLGANGVECVLEQNQDIRLIAIAAFLLDQENAGQGARERRRCEQLKQRIRELGKDYKLQAGYAFGECYERKH